MLTNPIKEHLFSKRALRVLKLHILAQRPCACACVCVQGRARTLCLSGERERHASFHPMWTQNLPEHFVHMSGTGESGLVNGNLRSSYRLGGLFETQMPPPPPQAPPPNEYASLLTSDLRHADAFLGAVKCCESDWACADAHGDVFTEGSVSADVRRHGTSARG